MKFNYKDLLASVKFNVAGLAIAFSRLSYKKTFVIGMALLNEILLLMFQNNLHQYFYKSHGTSANLKKDEPYLL